VYWYCAPDGDLGKTPAELKSEVGDFFKLNETTPTTDIGARGTVEVKPQDGDSLAYAPSWTAFQYRLFKSHLRDSTWSGAYISLTENEQTLTVLRELWAENKYYCWAYLEDD